MNPEPPTRRHLRRGASLKLSFSPDSSGGDRLFARPVDLDRSSGYAPSVEIYCPIESVDEEIRIALAVAVTQAFDFDGQLIAGDSRVDANVRLLSLAIIKTLAIVEGVIGGRRTAVQKDVEIDFAQIAFLPIPNISLTWEDRT